MVTTFKKYVAAAAALAMPIAIFAEEAPMVGKAGSDATSKRLGDEELRFSENKGAEGNKWHFSAGYEYRPAVKANVSFVSSLYTIGKPTPATPQFQSRAAASSAVSGGDYDDGYVHPDSGTGLDGDTTNWSANDMSQYNAGSETISFSSQYSESYSDIKAPMSGARDDEIDQSGITLDLSRTVYENGAFSVGVAVGFSFVQEDELLSYSHSFPLGSTSTSVRKIIDSYDVSYWAGSVPTTLTKSSDAEEGALIPVQPASTSDIAVGSGSSATYGGGADITLDFEMIEARIAVEPEYDFASWLSLFGQVGVAIGRGTASWEMTTWFSDNGNKKIYSNSDEAKDTFVQGFAGLGLRIMPFENLGISIFGDYRFGKGEVEFDANPFIGKIETGVLRVGGALTLAF